MNIKSYAHKSDAVRSFKKIFGAEADRSVIFQDEQGRFCFNTETSLPQELSPIELVAANYIPAELITQVSSRNLAQAVVALHPARTFPGREKNISGWIELANRRGIAIYQKEGRRSKVITVSL